jgi:hypothetical protein
MEKVIPFGIRTAAGRPKKSMSEPASVSSLRLVRLRKLLETGGKITSVGPRQTPTTEN